MSASAGIVLMWIFTGHWLLMDGMLLFLINFVTSSAASVQLRDAESIQIVGVHSPYSP